MKKKINEICITAVSVAFIVICSWLTVPGGVPYTMQSFAVFTVAALWGGRCGFFAVLTYILLGAVGIPVFSGMRGGIGILFGETGGYLFGFLAGSFVCGYICQKKKSITAMVGAMLLCLSLCYFFGCLWIYALFLKKQEFQGIFVIIGRFVLPFLIPDLIKLILSVGVVRALERRKAFSFRKY